MPGGIWLLTVYAAPCTPRTGHETAWALLARAHNALCGGPMPETARSEFGKPYFPDGRFAFSLSHARSIAACAVSDRPVGVDAEVFRPLRPGLAARVLNEPELDWFTRRGGGDETLLTLWTCKEALVKRSGQGLQFRPKEARLTFSGGAIDGFLLRRIWGGVIAVCPSVDEPAAWHLCHTLNLQAGKFLSPAQS